MKYKNERSLLCLYLCCLTVTEIKNFLIESGNDSTSIIDQHFTGIKTVKTCDSVFVIIILCISTFKTTVL